MVTLAVPQLLQECAKVIRQQAAASSAQGVHQLAPALGRQAMSALDSVAGFERSQLQVRQPGFSAHT
jgi:hypothetical protein